MFERELLCHLFPQIPQPLTLKDLREGDRRLRRITALHGRGAYVAVLLLATGLSSVRSVTAFL